MRPLIMLQLAAVTLAGEHRRQGSHSRRSGRHRLGKSLGKDLKPPKAAADERQLAELPDGFLWRITVADGSKMQLYAEEGRITTTAAYFSLFAIRVGTEGRHYLDTFVEVDGTRRLTPLSLRGEETKNRLLGIAAPPKAHVRRKKDRYASDTAPLPPPPPPPPPREGVAMYLHERPDGSYAVSLSKNGSHHLAEDRPQQVVIVRGRSWSENSTTYFFERIASTQPTEHSSSKLKPFSTRVKRSVVRVSGRELVVVSATTLPLIDQTSLGWAWLAVNGFSSLLLLTVERQTCDAALLINRDRNRSLRVHCVTPQDLSLPEAGSASAWSRQKPMVYGAPEPATACRAHRTNATRAHRAARLRLPRRNRREPRGRQVPRPVQAAPARAAPCPGPRCRLRRPRRPRAQPALPREPRPHGTRLGRWIGLAVGPRSGHHALATRVPRAKRHPPCPAPWCLRPARSHAPRPTSQARQSGYGDNNLGSCLRIPPAYKLWVNDWVGTGQFYLRSSPAALWFVQEVRARTHAARAVCVRRRVAHAWWACVVRMRLRARLRLRVRERVCERDHDHS